MQSEGLEFGDVEQIVVTHAHPDHFGAAAGIVFNVALRLQWQPTGERLVMGLAHLQGHLDLLEEAGRVTADTGGAAVSYRLRG